MLYGFEFLLFFNLLIEFIKRSPVEKDSGSKSFSRSYHRGRINWLSLRNTISKFHFQRARSIFVLARFAKRSAGWWTWTLVLFAIWVKSVRHMVLMEYFSPAFVCWWCENEGGEWSDEKLNKSVNIYVERGKNKAFAESRVIKVKVEDLLILLSRLLASASIICYTELVAYIA